MLNLILIMIPKIIKPQTVFFRIHDFAKFCLQIATLRRIQQTFKYRALYPLAIIDTLFCNLPQTFSSRSIFRIHIICNQY